MLNREETIQSDEKIGLLYSYSDSVAQRSAAQRVHAVQRGCVCRSGDCVTHLSRRGAAAARGRGLFLQPQH